MKIKLRTMTTVAMLCAITYVFMYVSKIIPPLEGFLQYDAKDVVITIGGFVFGPAYALIISVIVAFLELITVSHTGPIGLLMNIISTASFSCVASFIYFRKKTLSGAFLSLVTATLTLTAVMLLWNYFITPLYMNVPRNVIKTMLPTVFLPFNLLKGIINSGFILFMYRPIVLALKKMGLVERREGDKLSSIFSVTFFIGIIIVLIFIPVILVMTGVI
jgi:riboflavin transporter FmnP